MKVFRVVKFTLISLSSFSSLILSAVSASRISEAWVAVECSSAKSAVISVSWRKIK